MNRAPKRLFKIDDSQLIGKGSYGSVYRVHDSTGDIIAALKVCNTNGVMNQKMHASWQEFHILKKARIEQAEHIIYALHDYPSATNNSIQFEMEYATGGDLRTYLRNYPLLHISKQLVMWIGRQLLCGVQWLHSHSFMHTDLKPDNIMVFKGPNEPFLKIGDLGSCVEMDQNGTDMKRKINSCQTTYRYAAPEMLVAHDRKNSPLTFAADTFSWGVIMMEFAGTQNPFHPAYLSPGYAANNKQLEMRLDAMYAKRPRLLEIQNPRFEVEDLLAIYSKATQFEANKRPMITELLNEPLWANMKSFVKEELILPRMHQSVQNEQSLLSKEVSLLREAERNLTKQLHEARTRILSLEDMVCNMKKVSSMSTPSTSSNEASHAAAQTAWREEIRAAKRSLAREWARRAASISSSSPNRWIRMADQLVESPPHSNSTILDEPIYKKAKWAYSNPDWNGSSLAAQHEPPDSATLSAI